MSNLRARIALRIVRNRVSRKRRDVEYDIGRAHGTSGLRSSAPYAFDHHRLQLWGVSRMNITNIELGMRTLRRGLNSLRVACGIVAALTSPAAFAQQKVDTVVTNGKILTVDADFGVVEALAINDGRIVARGTSAEVARYAGPNTKVIDVKGATVIPGLIDNHFHFTRALERWHQQARFEGVNSRREALRILAAKAAALKPGDWIMVQGGWTPRQFADAPGGFTLAELDGVAPKNPLFVQEGYRFTAGTASTRIILQGFGVAALDAVRKQIVDFPSIWYYLAQPTQIVKEERCRSRRR